MNTSRRFRTRKGRLAHLALILIILVSISGMATATAQEQEFPSNCVLGPQPSGAVYLICMPPEGTWNGDLVVYAHGYVAPSPVVSIPYDQLFLPDGTFIPDLINSLGLAFATTSYRANGLIVGPAIEDLENVVSIFHDLQGATGRVYLVGVSEGSLNTTLAIEQNTSIFSGGLATCGPIGDFRKQLDYFGDARVLFDYFFPNMIPGSPVEIPDYVITNWESEYVPQITQALIANEHATQQLLATADIPVSLLAPEETVTAIIDVLWYNIFATNNAREVLGGQPFDNRRRIYVGSDNDLLLNREVQRFKADRKAIKAIEAGYQTSGDPEVPLVTLHTLKDPVIPYWHETLYNIKVLKNGDWRLHTNIPVLAYGHCNFKTRQVLVAFGTLVLKVSGHELQTLDSILSTVE